MVRVVSGGDWKPGESVNVFTIADPEKAPVGTIALPVRDHINSATASSIMGTNFSWLGERSISRVFIQGGVLTLQRNEAVQRMDGDWLLFIDDDMVWEPDAVKRLVEAREEHDLDMVGALCFRRTPPHQPTLYMRTQPTSGPYNFLEKWTDDIVEVDATGLAFCLIHKRVFERIAGSEMPPLEERLQNRPPNFFRWTGGFGEDLAFCQDVKASGGRIFVDTRIEIGHISEIEIRRRHYLIEIAQRGQEIEDSRREVNTMMGLPTMSTDEAKELLGW